MRNTTERPRARVWTYVCSGCEKEVEVRQEEDVLPPGWIETEGYDLFCPDCVREMDGEVA